MVEISVVIPSYNRAHLLSRTVESVKIQNFDDLEILVIDDGSSDDTESVVADLQKHEPRLRLVRHPQNRGEAAARNTGLRESRGRYIAFLDSDDVWLEGKLKHQHGALSNANGAYHAVVCGYLTVWPNGTRNQIDHWHFNKPITPKNLLMRGCGIGLGLNVMMEREAALSAGNFDESLPLYVDLDWLCRFLADHKMIAVNETQSVYHKADFRKGHFVEAAAQAFARKNRRLMQSWGLRAYWRSMAQLKWDSALSYKAHNDRQQFARTGRAALLYDPFVKIGNYLDVFDATTGLAITPLLKRIRRIF